MEEIRNRKPTRSWQRKPRFNCIKSSITPRIKKETFAGTNFNLLEIQTRAEILTAIKPAVMRRLSYNFKFLFGIQEIEDALTDCVIRLLDLTTVDLTTVDLLLYRATVNRLKDIGQLKSSRSTKNTQVRQEMMQVAATFGYSPYTEPDNLKDQKRLTIMQLASERLPAKQFLSVKMIVEEDKSGAQIARELGISENTFKANWRHAILKLRKIIEEEKLEFT